MGLVCLVCLVYLVCLVFLVENGFFASDFRDSTDFLLSVVGAGYGGIP
jgi:hypothetical protein